MLPNVPYVPKLSSLRVVSRLLLAALLFVAVSSPATIRIHRRHWIPNTNASRCGWASLETVARYYKLQSLYGIADAHNGLSAPWDLTAELDARGIRYVLQNIGEQDTRILLHVDKGRPVIVGLRTPGEAGFGLPLNGHIVVVVGLDRKNQMVEIVDSNETKNGQIMRLAWTKFRAYWDGFALVVLPPAK